MPDPAVTPKDAPAGFPDAAKHNAEVAQKLLEQDVMGKSTAPDPNANSGDELDKLAQAAEKQHEEGTPPPEVKPAPAAPPTPEEKAAAEQAAAEAAAKAEQQKRADELFKDSPSLPPNASPKSSEAFSSVKIKAAQEIAAREAELEKLRKDKAELEQRLQNQAPPEAVKELEEHRKWRARLDVEADPKFKEFDRQVLQSQEFIYSQLLKSPKISKEVIAEIKKFGGPEMVNMSKIFEAIGDPMTQRLVESKIADIEMAKFNKSQALTAAKENITEYIKEREQQFSQASLQHTQATEKYLAKNISVLDWFKVKEVPSGADAATKKQIEDDNLFVQKTQADLKEALKDDSAEMRAVMLTGMAQLFKLQRDLPAVTAERDALKKQVTELTAKLDKIKNASVSRIRESGAAPGAAAKIERKESDIFKPATQAVDDLMKQVMEERERANATGR